MLQYKPATIQDLLFYCVRLYYMMLEEDDNKGIRADHPRHFHEVEKIERYYHKLLKANSWYKDENINLFRNQIDFLTGVYTKEREENEWKRKMEAFRKMALNE